MEPGDEIREYDRDDWNHWTDADSDCQDARQEVLIRDADSTITFEEREDGRECRVASGLWVDPYGGDTIRDPGDLDIDHIVPLQNAHCSGGWRWTVDRKEEYAKDLSDPEHLLAVDLSDN